MRHFHMRHMGRHRDVPKKSIREMLRTFVRLLGYVRPWWYLMVCVLALAAITDALGLEEGNAFVVYQELKAGRVYSAGNVLD